MAKEIGTLYLNLICRFYKLNVDKHFGQPPLQSGTDFTSEWVYKLSIAIGCWCSLYKLNIDKQFLANPV